MELALMCDLRVVAEDMKMGIFNRRFGVPLLDGGTAKVAMHCWSLTCVRSHHDGRPVDAKEALSRACVNRVVPKEKAS
ncbi:enoyl-CoA hydratase isomerase [Desmophyllum pertusum]|uniref:Enoyl-CoA hydratase isomerase n=1 Tax=Desmophyllum pertusum TaxID=174260 RepID=A0A9W9YPF5_9CNID|nr:enoyl-CoA hydratase isomerase [Desmophyllum pertusum]